MHAVVDANEPLRSRPSSAAPGRSVLASTSGHSTVTATTDSALDHQFAVGAPQLDDGP